MKQTRLTTLTDRLTFNHNTRPFFCSSTHAPGHFHHHCTHWSCRKDTRTSSIPYIS